MVTDAVFAYGAHDFVSRHVAHAKNNSIFQYLYTHEGKFRVFVPKEISLLCFFISRNNIIVNFNLLPRPKKYVDGRYRNHHSAIWSLPCR